MADLDRKVTLWAQTQDGEPIKEDALYTLARVEKIGHDGTVDLHVFAAGEDKNSIVSLTLYPADAEAIGLDLIRTAVPDDE